MSNYWFPSKLTNFNIKGHGYRFCLHTTFDQSGIDSDQPISIIKKFDRIRLGGFSKIDSYEISNTKLTFLASFIDDNSLLSGGLYLTVYIDENEFWKGSMNDSNLSESNYYIDGSEIKVGLYDMEFLGVVSSLQKTGFLYNPLGSPPHSSYLRTLVQIFEDIFIKEFGYLSSDIEWIVTPEFQNPYILENDLIQPRYFLIEMLKLFNLRCFNFEGKIYITNKSALDSSYLLIDKSDVISVKKVNNPVYSSDGYKISTSLYLNYSTKDLEGNLIKNEVGKLIVGSGSKGVDFSQRKSGKNDSSYSYMLGYKDTSINSGNHSSIVISSPTVNPPSTIDNEYYITSTAIPTNIKIGDILHIAPFIGFNKGEYFVALITRVDGNDIYFSVNDSNVNIDILDDNNVYKIQRGIYEIGSGDYNRQNFPEYMRENIIEMEKYNQPKSIILRLKNMFNYKKSVSKKISFLGKVYVAQKIDFDLMNQHIILELIEEV